MDRPADRLEVLVGYACNNRCRFCSESVRRAEARSAPGGLPWSKEAIVERLGRARRAARGLRHLTLLGGEPTLHPGFLDIVRAAFRLGFDELFVTTNGRMLARPGFLAAVAAAGPVTWCVSIHGPDAATHDGLTRVPDSFRQALEGMRLAVRSGARVFGTTTVVRPNLARLPATVRLLRRAGARHIHVAFARPMGACAAAFETLVPRIAEVAGPLAAARREAGRVPIRFANLPLCAYPPRLAGHADELGWASPRRRTVLKPRPGGGGERFDDWAGRLKVHGPPCVRCAARPACEGIWQLYARRRGFDECRPRRRVPARRGGAAPLA